MAQVEPWKEGRFFLTIYVVAPITFPITLGSSTEIDGHILQTTSRDTVPLRWRRHALVFVNTSQG